MDYISREDAFSDAMCVGISCQECPFLIHPINGGCKVENYIKSIPAADVIERNTLQHTQCVESVKNALDVEERKVNKISDLEFLYEEFKNVPNLVCCDCECDGAPGIMMIIPIGEKEINLYFDFYGSLCK